MDYINYIPVVLTYFVFFVLMFLRNLNPFDNRLELYLDNPVLMNLLDLLPFIIIGLIAVSTIKIKSLIKRYIIVLILLLASTIGYFSIFNILDSKVEQYFGNFTYEKWCKYPDKREFMIEDLEKMYKFKGMKKEEVEAILGPQEIFNNEMKYEIGEFLHREYLIFKFEKDEVISVETRWD